MVKAFIVGLVIGVLLVSGGIYYYFASGMAPVATTDPSMPFERQLAHKALDAHIEKAAVPAPPIPADEANLLAGANVYKDQCAGCHGLAMGPDPSISDAMFPHAPMLLKGKGVTDDPPSESFWKVENGIRLSGMPGFKGTLNDTQMWQVAQLVANADKIPNSVKAVLAPVSAGGAPAGER